MSFASTLPIMMPRKSSEKGSMIGAKMRRLREQKGWSQGDVGASIGRIQSRVAKWELGQGEPEPADIVRIADLFDVDLRYLCDDSKTEPHESGTEKTDMAHGESSWTLTEDEKFLIMLSREVGGARHIASRFLASLSACEEQRPEDPVGPTAPIRVHKRPPHHVE